jgi:small subunit ribosomal protein S20
MANIKSNEKRAKQSEKRYLRNKMWKEKVKTLRKKIIKSILTKSVSEEELKRMIKEYQSLVDKTYTKNVFKKNKVARLKSKIFNFLKKNGITLNKLN